MTVIGKKFAADFERIDDVNAADKVLIYDSSTGLVKYATPSQINAKFDDLVADIDTAIAAASTATTKASEASSSAATAASSANTALGYKSDAEDAAGDAENAATDAHSAVDIIAEAECSADERLARLENFVRKLVTGDVFCDKITTRELNLQGTTSLVRQGAGAPTTAPDYIGQFYVDTTNGDYYKSTGNESVSNWVIL